MPLQLSRLIVAAVAAALASALAAAAEERKGPRMDMPIPYVTLATVGNLTYGDRPFVLRGAMSGWAANGKWNLDHLLRHFSPNIVDYYPRNLYKTPASGNYPILARMDHAVPGFYNSIQTGGTPQYIMWRMDLKSWKFLNADMEPVPSFWDDMGWIEECAAPKTSSSWPADNLVRHTQWRMLVIGTTGSGMFLHADGLRTATWQAQMFGRKRFVLCAPDQAPYLYQPGDLDVFEPDLQRFPLFKQANCTELLLNPGEIVYYPNGWFHMTKVIDPLNFGLTGRAVNSYNYMDFYRQLKHNCDFPGKDISKEYEGASPNLHEANCRSLKRCRKAWRKRFEHPDQAARRKERLAKKRKADERTKEAPIEAPRGAFTNKPIQLESSRPPRKPKVDTRDL